MLRSTIDREGLLQLLRNPTTLAGFNLRQWDALLPIANQLGILPYLVARLDAAGVSDSLPEGIGIHLESARLRSRWSEHLEDQHEAARNIRCGCQAPSGRQSLELPAPDVGLLHEKE